MITNIKTTALLPISTSIAMALTLFACGSDYGDTAVSEAQPQPTEVATAPVAKFKIGLLPDTQGGSDSEGQTHVALHPMKNVLAHQEAAGVNMVLALGDLPVGGSAEEFAEWSSVDKQYQAKGIEFLLVMGNY